MRITIARTGETLEVATGKRGGDKDGQARVASIICREVKPRFTSASNKRARAFKKGGAA